LSDKANPVGRLCRVALCESGPRNQERTTPTANRVSPVHFATTLLHCPTQPGIPGHAGALMNRYRRHWAEPHGTPRTSEEIPRGMWYAAAPGPT